MREEALQAANNWKILRMKKGKEIEFLDSSDTCQAEFCLPCPRGLPVAALLGACGLLNGVAQRRAARDPHAVCKFSSCSFGRLLLGKNSNSLRSLPSLRSLSPSYPPSTGSSAVNSEGRYCFIRLDIAIRSEPDIGTDEVTS